MCLEGARLAGVGNDDFDVPRELLRDRRVRAVVDHGHPAIETLGQKPGEVRAAESQAAGHQHALPMNRHAFLIQHEFHRTSPVWIYSRAERWILTSRAGPRVRIRWGSS